MAVQIIKFDNSDTTQPVWHFTNNGAELEDTNYFLTEHAAHGVIFVSWNAGAARILIPKSQEDVIRAEVKDVVKADLEFDATGNFMHFWFNDGQAEEFNVMIMSANSDIYQAAPKKKIRTEVLIYTESYGLVLRCPLNILPK